MGIYDHGAKYFNAGVNQMTVRYATFHLSKLRSFHSFVLSKEADSP